MTTDESKAEPPRPLLPEIPNWLCLCLLGAFTLVMLGKVLFISPHEVLSDGQMDLANEYVNWRYFGFNELKAGHLALWNPHVYCGEPFFGSFQSALLYPLNFLYLLAPLDAAINWTIALHVFLGGMFMFYWTRWRGLHSLACLLSAMMFMFCGPHFLQIHAGHLSNLCTLIWAPLLFLVNDRLTDRPSLGACLAGMLVVTLAILAGHPQYVFYMGVAAAVYSLLNLARARDRGKVMMGLGGIVAGAICLSAVQLFTGLEESRESMRSLGMSYAFASSGSFPPECLLTMLAPWCFGDEKTVHYWGPWSVTEVGLFISVIGLALAVYGMARGAPAMRRFSITMMIVALVLALGGYTPVYHLLFNYAPGFSLFRGPAKFLWLAALFLSMLAGVGLDQLLRGRDVPWWLIAGLAVAGIALGGLAVVPRHLDWWGAVLKMVPESERMLPDMAYSSQRFIAQTSVRSCQSLIGGAVCLFVAAGLFTLAKPRRQIACGGMLLMAVIELASFGQTSLVTFALSPPYSPTVVKILAADPGDYRIACQHPNGAVTTGSLDIGGDDPSATLRYIRYFCCSMGVDYDEAQYSMVPRFFNYAAWRMLRCHYVFWESLHRWKVLEGGLPRLMLVDRFRVMTNYHEMFSTLTNVDFPVNEEIILEKQPDPLPQPAPDKGTVKILESSTDDVTVEADAKTPCLLLMTDSYSSGWRALALPGSSQARYEIMPANYCLRAIPLAAGHHLLRIEYSPLGFRIGKVVSIAAWAIFIVLTGLAVRRGSPSGA